MRLESWERVPDREVLCPPFTGGLPWDGKGHDVLVTRIVDLHRAIKLNPHDERVPEWQAELRPLLMNMKLRRSA